MSDTAPAPAFMDAEEIAPKKRTPAGQTKPEWVRQAWLYHFAERVLLPPFEVRCIDQASAAQANIKSRMMAIARGCKPGTSDILLWQGAPCVMSAIEVKHETGASDAQKAYALALGRCGFHVTPECRTASEALVGLRAAGFRLHGNATNLATEFDARIEGGLRDLKLRKAAGGKRKASKPRSARVSPSRIARAERARRLPQ